MTLHRRAVIYVSPTKALCRQQLDDWSKSFAAIGLRCLALTGDEGTVAGAVGADVLFTTPEKLDSLTRRWRDPEQRGLYGRLGLVLVDEAHLLGEGRRGATLEVVISRLRFVCASQERPWPLRLGAVSATVPNIEALGSWVGAPAAAVLTFGAEFRPVPLEIAVQGFGQAATAGGAPLNDFMLERDLDAALPSVLLQFGSGRPALVFCSSRRGARAAAESVAASPQLVAALSVHPHHGQQQHLGLQLQQQQQQHAALRVLRERAAAALPNQGDEEVAALRRCMCSGVAWHCAGLAPGALRVVEDAFRQGVLACVCATTTLMMGVNLPAQLVVVKGTTAYRGAGRGCEALSNTTLLQMVGRAGRLGFDASGMAVIMTRRGLERDYADLLTGAEPVRSTLQPVMREALVCEVVVGAVRSIEEAYAWLESTFLFVSEGRQSAAAAAALRSAVLAHLMAARELGCVEQLAPGAPRFADCGGAGAHGLPPDEPRLVGTPLGELLVRAFLRLETVAVAFRIAVAGPAPGLGEHAAADDDAGVRCALAAVAAAQEFAEDFPLRRDQKNDLNDVGWRTGRFKGRKNKDRVQSPADKAFQLLQAYIGGVTLTNTVLRSEALEVGAEAVRVAGALVAFLEMPEQASAMAVHGQVLLRSLRARCWPAQGELLQLDQIGHTLYEKLIALGVHTLQQYLDCATSMREKLVAELGRSRFQRSHDAARAIAAGRVELRVSKQFVPPDKLALDVLLDQQQFPQQPPQHMQGQGHRQQQPAASPRGFEVYVVAGLRLLHHKYMRPGERLSMVIDKGDIDTDTVTVHAIHPTLHGLDVQQPRAKASPTQPRARAAAAKAAAPKTQGGPIDTFLAAKDRAAAGPVAPAPGAREPAPEPTPAPPGVAGAKRAASPPAGPPAKAQHTSSVPRFQAPTVKPPAQQRQSQLPAQQHQHDEYQQLRDKAVAEHESKSASFAWPAGAPRAPSTLPPAAAGSWRQQPQRPAQMLQQPQQMLQQPQQTLQQPQQLQELRQPLQPLRQPLQQYHQLQQQQQVQQQLVQQQQVQQQRLPPPPNRPSQPLSETQVASMSFADAFF